MTIIAEMTNYRAFKTLLTKALNHIQHARETKTERFPGIVAYSIGLENFQGVKTVYLLG